MPVVYFVKQQRAVECPVGANLRDVARQNGIDVYVFPNNLVNCRGNGLCGTCRVLVKKGMENLSPKTFMERFNFNAHPLTMLAVIGHEDEMRLSCQVRVNGDCSVETQPAMNWSGENFWQKPYPNK